MIIIGCVVGAVVFATAILVTTICFYCPSRRQRDLPRRSKTTNPHSQVSDMPTDNSSAAATPTLPPDLKQPLAKKKGIISKQQFDEFE
jgi:hypothetical protein